eukprot:m.35366 g.35366  ORF g.35366 m.35366 type:complete len:231 (-) comp11131_c2_seq2:147-839(-)
MYVEMGNADAYCGTAKYMCAITISHNLRSRGTNRTSKMDYVTDSLVKARVKGVAKDFGIEEPSQEQKQQEAKQKKKHKKEEQELEVERQQRTRKQQQRRADLEVKHQAIREKYGLEAKEKNPFATSGSSSVYLSGNLLKRGKINTSFKKRWFELKDTRLAYHSAPYGAEKGHIDLTSSMQIRLVTEDGHLELHLETSNRTFVMRSLKAKSQQEKELREWETAISTAFQKL